jgi:anaerobic C4-dicarboxylate transporter DcuA
MVWIELCILLACILVGARLGGIGLGTVAGLGLVVMVFILGLPPGMPPRTVLGMIVAVVTAAATMQAAGGLNYLAALADRALRVWPAGITIIAPIVTYVVTFAAGTVHIVYALLPVIAEVSRKAGIRPERPLSISVIASQQAITASPISAATVALLALLSPKGVTLQQILMICIPSTLLGSIIGAVSVLRKGPNLEDDPIYKQRLAQGLVSSNDSTISLTGKQLTRARGSVIVFLLAAVMVVVLGLIPSMRPTYTAVNGGGQETIEQLDMAPAIMIMMFAAAGINMLLFKAAAADTVKSSIMSAGMVALISIAGLGWLGSSFFEGNKAMIVASISGAIQQHPWVFALGLFVLSILLASQAATVVTLMPVAVGLGLGAPTLIAMFPAVNGYFFLPTYATMLAAISFDQTGTTRIGKYVLNHSFMLPGLVATISSVTIGFVLAKFVL